MYQGYSNDNSYFRSIVTFSDKDLEELVIKTKQQMPKEMVIPFLTRYKVEIEAAGKKAMEQFVLRLLNEHAPSLVFKIEPQPKTKKSLVTVEEAIS
jgi:hypothetical protein